MPEGQSDKRSLRSIFALVALLSLLCIIGCVILLALLGPAIGRLTNADGLIDPEPCQLAPVAILAFDGEAVAEFPLPAGNTQPITRDNAARLDVLETMPVPDSLLSYRAGFHDGMVRVVDNPHWREDTLVVSPDGSQGVMIDGFPSEATIIRVCDPNTRKQITAFMSDETSRAVAFTPDGTRFILNEGRGTILVYDADTRSRLATWDVRQRGEQWRVTSHMTISPNGRIAAFVEEGTTINLWDTSDNERITTLDGHSDMIIDLFFTPDGSLLVTYGMDDTLRVWGIP